MEPTITDCYYQSNKTDNIATAHNLNSLPPNFPSCFTIENGKLVLYYYLITVYIGTGLLRTWQEPSNTQVDYLNINLRGSVCYCAKSNEYTSLNFTTRQAETNVPSKFYRTNMSVVSNLSNEDYLSWFVDLFANWEFGVQYTLTNLLGNAGSFETDSNSDGLADEWNISSGLGKQLEQIDGLSWQRFWETYSTSSRALIKEFNAITNNIYFVRLKQIVTTNDSDTRYAGTVRLYDYNTNKDSGIVLEKFPTALVGSKIDRYNTIKTLSNKPSIVIYTSSQGVSISGKRYDVWVTQVGIYDLSALGRLPTTLANYVGKMYWTELNTNQPIRSLDGTVKTGIDWLAQLLPYVKSTTPVTIVLNFPFKSQAAYYYKPYIFKYDSEYKATIDIGETIKTELDTIELSYGFEGRIFKTTKQLSAETIRPVELVALLQSTSDAVLFKNCVAAYNTKYSTLANNYSLYVAEQSTGLWYYDRANENIKLYPLNEILLIHKDNMDKLGEKIYISDVQVQRIYITPFTRSNYAIILVPEGDSRVALRFAGLSETFWKVENNKFVIDSGYWYALYINLLEELSGPDDDQYELVNSVFISNNATIPTATNAFSITKEGNDWYLVFNRELLTSPAEEFYCLVTLWDVFDNFDTAFVYATGYVEYAGKKHKTYTKTYQLTKDKFVLSEGTNAIPLTKYLKVEDDK